MSPLAFDNQRSGYLLWLAFSLSGRRIATPALYRGSLYPLEVVRDVLRASSALDLFKSAALIA